jgi:hypothetical protein
MANIIKIRRGAKVNLPASGTREGELRFATDTKDLYIDDGINNVLLGGKTALENIGATITEAVKPEHYVIDGNDQVLVTSATGIRSYLSLTYDSVSGNLYLKGKSVTDGDDNTVVRVLSTVNLPVDQFLKSAEIVVDPEDRAVGTYLLLTFNTASGDNEVYVDVGALVDTYTSANQGIDVTGRVITLEVDSNSNLAIGNDGLGFATGYEAISSSSLGTLISHISETGNPHGTSKDDLGLGNVDNTADEDKTIDGGIFTVITAPEE